LERLSQSRPDSGLGLSRFSGESVETHLGCSLLAHQRMLKVLDRQRVGVRVERAETGGGEDLGWRLSTRVSVHGQRVGERVCIRGLG